MHRNARLTPWGRQELVRRIKSGRPIAHLDALRVAREALARTDLATPRDTGDRDALAALLAGPPSR